LVCRISSATGSFRVSDGSRRSR